MDDWLNRHRATIVTSLLAIIAVGVVVLLLRWPKTTPLTPLPPPTATPERTIVVQVSGAVNRPDVYTLRESDRVKEAIAAAGGVTAEANLDAINLAERLQDGQRLHVPKRGETVTPAPTAMSGSPGRININTATLSELDTLKGIGPVTAQKIIDYRTKNGPFKRLEELVEAKLLSKSLFDSLKDQLTVQ